MAAPTGRSSRSADQPWTRLPIAPVAPAPPIAPEPVDHEGWIEEFLLAYSPDAFVRHDGTGRIAWVSPNAHAIFAVQRSALLAADASEHFNELVPKAYRRALERNLDAIRRGQPVTCTYRIAGHDGARRWVESVFTAVLDDEGQVVEIRSLTRDIDRFRRPIEQFAVRERRWRAALDTVPVVLIQIDTNFEIVAANRSAVATFKRGLRRLLGRNVLSLLCAPNSVEEHALRDHLTTNRYGETEFYSAPANRWFNLAYYTAADGEGSLREALIRILDVTPRKAIEEKLNRSLTGMRQLAARLQSVREEERARISREIHDELGHQLTGLSLNLGWLRSRLRSNEVLTKQVDYMLSILDSTWSAMRRISTELRPAVLDHLGLAAAVQWQCDEFSQHAGISLSLDLAANHLHAESGVATTLFRVLQEALTNVARHANASHVDVSLHAVDGHLVLSIADDGRGFDPEARTESVSCGLFGMEQRAVEQKGHFSLDSAPGRGTRIEVRVPAPQA